jgi:hypothetical protein
MIRAVVLIMGLLGLVCWTAAANAAPMVESATGLDREQGTLIKYAFWAENCESCGPDVPAFGVKLAPHR